MIRLLGLVAAIAAAAYLVVDADAVKAVLVVAVSGAGALAVAAGIRRHRPRPLWPWLLVLGGQLLWTVAWVAWELPVAVDGSVPSAGSSIDLLFVAGNLCVVASLAALLCLRERDAVGIVGGVTTGASLAVVAWAVLLHRYTD